jgi:hypothetical protein
MLGYKLFNNLITMYADFKGLNIESYIVQSSRFLNVKLGHVIINLSE